MKTWRIRLVDAAGRPVTQARALWRYLMSWIWFVPALATVSLSGLKGGPAVAAIVAAGVLGYAWGSRLHPQRQYWHDALCGTRLIDTRGS